VRGRGVVDTGWRLLGWLVFVSASSLARSLVCTSVCLCVSRPAPCSLSPSTPPPPICPTPLHIVSTPHECHGAMGDVRASCRASPLLSMPQQPHLSRCCCRRHLLHGVRVSN